MILNILYNAWFVYWLLVSIVQLWNISTFILGHFVGSLWEIITISFLMLFKHYSWSYFLNFSYSWNVQCIHRFKDYECYSCYLNSPQDQGLLHEKAEHWRRLRDLRSGRKWECPWSRAWASLVSSVRNHGSGIERSVNHKGETSSPSCTRELKGVGSSISCRSFTGFFSPFKRLSLS